MNEEEKEVPKGEEGGDDYGAAYSDESLWNKIGRFALRAGKELIRRVLILYYCLHDPDTPAWAKGVIVAALGYFILPLDAIPDFIPGVGFSDDLGALALALGTVALYVKPEHKEKAEERLRVWFGEEEES